MSDRSDRHIGAGGAAAGEDRDLRLAAAIDDVPVPPRDDAFVDDLLRRLEHATAPELKPRAWRPFAGRGARPRLSVVVAAVAAAVVVGGGVVYGATVLLRPSPSFRQTASGWRQVPLNAAWRAALSRRLPLSRHASLTPLALAHDGRSFFAAMDAKHYSGVVRIDAESGRVLHIARFAHPRVDQASDGAFDGRWLVWGESTTLQDPSVSSAWSWDARTRRLRRLPVAYSRTGARSSSEPILLRGRVTWTTPTGPRGASAVHVFDLATGRDRVVYRGRADGSLLVDGGLVLWYRATGAGLRVSGAASVATGAAAAVPAAFAGRTLAGLSTDGRTVVRTDMHATSLWWSGSLHTVPRRLFTVVTNAAIDDSIQVAGPLISFAVAPRAYLADTRLRRYVEISAGGWALLDDDSMVLLEASQNKLDSRYDVVFVRLSSLPPLAAQQ